MWIHKLKCEQTVLYMHRVCRPSPLRFVSSILVHKLLPATVTVSRLIANYMSMWTPVLSISSPSLHLSFCFSIYTWLSMISCRSLRITDWQGFLVHWHIMTLQLLHRRGGGTFGQTEREAGMKQKLLIQVRIDLLYNYPKQNRTNSTHLCRHHGPFVFLKGWFLLKA